MSIRYMKLRLVFILLAKNDKYALFTLLVISKKCPRGELYTITIKLHTRYWPRERVERGPHTLIGYYGQCSELVR